MNTVAITLRKIKRPGPRGRTREEWALRWYDSEGRHRCEKIGDVKSMPKREANAIRRKKQADMEAKRIPQDRPKTMTIEQFAEYHKEVIGQDRKPQTRYQYELALRRVIQSLGGDFPIRKIGPTEAAKVRNGLQGADATRAKHISRLRAIFNRAVKWEVMEKNPFRDQPMPRFGPRKMRIFKQHEIDAMVKVAKTAWWKAYLLVGFTTGLRKEEIANLVWSDVDFDSKVLQVNSKRAERFTGSNGYEYRTLAWTPKDYESRSIPVPEETLAALQTLRREVDESPYVFLRLERLTGINAKQDMGIWRARAETLNNILRDFRAIQTWAARHLEVDNWELGSVHDMRRTFGTRMAETTPMHRLRALMGHADINTTALFYVLPASTPEHTQ